MTKNDEKSVALRFNSGKETVSYMLDYPSVMKVMARIMEFGACKYEDGNWKLGGKPDREYLDSALRHLLQWVSGEEFDSDSGCNHIGHAIWNLCTLLQLNYPNQIIDEEIFKKQCEYWKSKKRDASTT